MQCPNCGEQIESGTDKCPHCGHEAAVTVLSRQERDNFDGITIEEENGGNRSRYESYESGNRSRVKHINISFGSSGWAGKLMVAAVLVILVFFFLPVLLFILLAVGAVLIGAWLFQLLRR